jgi:carbamoyl-phosphate synthase small subunit
VCSIEKNSIFFSFNSQENMKLFLANGSVKEGKSFGATIESEGEVVFTTGMTGYLETLTDPSYFGQIICFTFPLLGNYGVFDQEMLVDNVDKVYESRKIWVRGVIVAEESANFSHALAKSSFGQWLKKNNIPALSGVDTRGLTQVLREHGTLWGKIGKQSPAQFIDELGGRFVPHVSPRSIEILEPPHQKAKKTIAFIDCGAKNGIFRNFLKRGIRVYRMPFDHNPFELKEQFDGIFFSNGPGDPETVTETIEIARMALEKDIPVFGICLGNQILALAAGGKTRKMKYGHRGVNQPVRDVLSGKCLITTQNHGFEVDRQSLPQEFQTWFENLNDHSNEGIYHRRKPIFATQFHPEACAGPEDAQYLFDTFIAQL